MNNKERRNLAIIQQNVRGRDIENDGLWSMQDYIEMAKEIKYKYPDIVFLQNFIIKRCMMLRRNYLMNMNLLNLLECQRRMKNRVDYLQLVF